MKPCIAVDARQVYRPCRRGTGKNLIDLYRRLAQKRTDWRFVMLHQSKDAADPFGGIPNIEARRVDIRGGDRLNLWEQVRLPWAARQVGATVVHSPANTGPRFPLRPLVLTVHDVIPLEIAARTAASRTWARRVAAAARAARLVVTPSQYSKEQIVRRLGIQPEKIVVNHWAADRRCSRVTDCAELSRVRCKYGLQADQPYVLMFAAADPRKNTPRVLEAWKRLSPALRREYRLLAVGIEAEALPDFRRLAAGHGLDGDAVLNGFADEVDIAPLLSGATLLCYPSLAEGFGLPVLDAFACATPVLTSGTTSLPEVAGSAAVLVDPSRTDSVAEGLERLLSDAALRAALVNKGFERLQQFTWDKCADRLAGVMEAAACGW